MLAGIEACIPALRRYAAALTRNRHDADDLVHECLVRALDKLHTRRDDGDVRAWLFTILHNVFVSQRRRAATRGETTALDDLPEALGGLREQQENRLHFQDVARELDALPDDQRQVILLIAVEDLSYAEAARVLGVPIGTVMSRLSRGRERLRRAAQEPARPGLRRVK